MFRLDESDMAYGLTTVKYTVAFKSNTDTALKTDAISRKATTNEKTLTQLKYGDI